MERWSRKGSPKTYVRMDLPMSLRCNGCGEYMYKGTLFRSRREEAEISRAGIHRFRFYLNCTGCSAELVIKIYPHYPHFIVETGATRCVSTDEEAGATLCVCTDEEAGATRSVSTDEEAGATDEEAGATDEEAGAQTSP